MLLPWVLCVILSMMVLVLCAKNYLLKKSILEICIELTEKLKTDTNTLISVSSGDKQIRRLACELNKQLRLLRSERRRYLNGDRELKDAITNISHDLRTPLTAICGYLDLLEQEKKSEAASRYLSLITNRTNALKQLTEELFRYSIIMSAEKPMTLEKVRMNDALEESIASFYEALTKRGITPEIEITETPIICYANKEALMRIFNNIFSNVLKYSEGDLKIELLETGELVFSNTAHNLSEVQIGRLFDRFFSVEAARNSTGLGLAISKTLVEQMGGTITAQRKGEKLNISYSLIKVGNANAGGDCMDGNTELLNYVYQNTKMGTDTLDQLIEIAEDADFIKQLSSQREEYRRMQEDAVKLLNEKGHQEKEIGAMAKIMAYLSINMKTLTDKSPSHIAEMLIQGSTMGTIDAAKNRNQYPNADAEILALVEKLLKTEERNIESLKKFL